MNQYKVHHIKFYQPETTAIHCLAFEESLKKLALSRSNNSIEIWDLSATSYNEKILFGKEDESVEALAWCDGRLFSTGLQGYILEYDLLKLSTKNKEPVFSGPAWCLGVSPNKKFIAIGTENGEICLFDVLPAKVKFLKTLGKQESRVLSISWHKSNDYIVTGSLDIIQVWSLDASHSIQRMTTGRTEKNNETIVWCVHFLSDFTIVSGDSRGKVCFWNGKTGSLNESMQSHKADVLTIAVEKDENKVICGGVDPVIAEFSRIFNHHDNSMKKSKWMKSLPRNIHTHDVRALTIAGNYLVSGGVDTYMVLSKYSPKVCLKYPEISHKNIVHVARKSHCIMFQYKCFVEVWKLGQSSHDSGRNGDILPLCNEPIKLLELRAKSDASIICSAISEDATWISFSTVNGLKLFQLSIIEINESVPKVTLAPVLSLPLDCKGGHILKFTPNGKYLLIATPTAEIQVLALDTLQPSLIHTFPSLNDTIHLMSISDDGKFAAVANNKSVIQVYDLVNFQIQCSVPHYKHQPSAMTIHPESDKLLVVYTDHKVVEFDFLKKEYTSWSRNLKLSDHSNWQLQSNVITNITFDQKNPDVMIFQNDNTVTLLEKSTMNGTVNERKLRRKDGENERSSMVGRTDNDALRMCKKYKHLVYFGNIEQDEMVAVELTPASIFDKLPSALKQKKYGT